MDTNNNKLMSQIYKQDYVSGGLLGVINQPTIGSTGVPANAIVKSTTGVLYINEQDSRTVGPSTVFSTANGWAQAAATSDVDDVVVEGNRLKLDEDGTSIGNGVALAQGTSDNDIVATKGYVDAHPGEANVQSDWSQSTNSAPDFIENKPDITVESGVTVLNGATRFENASGDQVLSVGSGGDIHIGDGTDTFMLIEKSNERVYYNGQNTGTLATSDDNEIMNAGGLEIGATSIGHVDHPNTASEDAQIILGYDNRVISRG